VAAGGARVAVERDALGERLVELELVSGIVISNARNGDCTHTSK
jgi:hypothetical protein